QPDRQSFGARVLVGGCELAVKLPLNVLVKHNGAPMFLLERGRFGAVKAPIRRRPLLPGPHVRVPAVQVFVERAVSGKTIEQVAFPADELAKAVILLAGLTPSPQEFQEAKLQKPKLERGHALVLHELRCAKSRNLAADLGCRPEPAGAAGPVEILDAFHIQVNEVLIKNRIGKIGAGIKWPPVMDRVQRIERDETGLAVLN